MTKALARKIPVGFILHGKLMSDITTNLIENEDNYVLLNDFFLGLMTKNKLINLLKNSTI